MIGCHTSDHAHAPRWVTSSSRAPVSSPATYPNPIPPSRSAAGSRIRFDPERSWADNGNLDKARRLLQPIKTKFGVGLSWGDLIVLAGTIAIQAQGGPYLGMCYGRVDDTSGFWSHELGPNDKQAVVAPCPYTLDGTPEIAAGDTTELCKDPFGAVQQQLIYVNPGGCNNGDHDPVCSARQIRSSFGRMGMNDTETVSLVGGGHAFGKGHGICPDGGGMAPNVDPANPWAGTCNTGKGKDATTSGFEGPWTETPTVWSKLYFEYLRDFEYEITGGNNVWHMKNKDKKAPMPFDVSATQDVMMLTSDIAMIQDSEYNPISMEYANNLQKLEHDFKHSWYKLMTRDMGPISRCVNKGDLPAALPWQNPLPMASGVDYDAVKADLVASIPHDKIYAVIYAAYQSANTFRITDYRGGANGATIRFSPQADYPTNAGVPETLMMLDAVKARHHGLSSSDLIVLAGTAALEAMGAGDLPFCGGRTDAADGEQAEGLAPWDSSTASINAQVAVYAHQIKISGLSEAEYLALRGTVMCLGSGMADSVDRVPHDCFQRLISEPRPWSAAVTTGPMETRTFTDDEGYTIPWHLMAFAWMPGTLATASTFASDPDRYMATLRAAWTKLMTADRFDGPTGNVCDAQLDDMTCTPANVGAACGSPTAGKSCTCHGHHARNLLFASTPMRDHCRCA